MSGMVRGYKRKRHYSTSQRILVHLSSVASSHPDKLPTLTQQGIAEVVLTGRSTATRWLGRLTRRGLVASERAKVPGYRVRKTVYRLTSAGWKAAQEVRERLGADLVEVRAPALDPVSMKVSDVPRFFPTRVDLTLAVCLVGQGRLDLTRLPDTHSESSPLVWGQALRRPDRLFGRSEESRFLDAWRGSSSPILVVSGLAGVGKSSLAANWVLGHLRGFHVFWYELDAPVTPFTFLADLGAFLARLGHNGLASYLYEAARVDLRFAVRILSHEARGLPILMVLDSFERAQTETAAFLERSILGLTAATRTRIILVSRNRLRLKARPVQALPLKGLAIEDSIRLLDAIGFRGDLAATRKLAIASRGHPLLLKFAALSNTGASGTVKGYLEGEIFSRLSPAELASLEAASIFRGVAPIRVLRSMRGVTGPAIASLGAKNLLELTVAGDVAVHDLVRDFVRSQLGEERRRGLHEEAARRFVRTREPRERLEGLYHLLQAGRTKAAAKLLDARDVPLMEFVSAHEISAMLHGINPSNLDSASASIFSEQIADGLRLVGDLAPALLQYKFAVRRCQSRRPNRIPRLLRKMAHIERCRNRYPQAMGYLVESQARLARTSNPAELAEVFREMALVEQAQGDLQHAAAHLNEAIDLATEASDSGALVRGLLALGSLEAQRGQKERSLDYKLEGLRIAERSGNVTEMARGNIAVGTAQVELGRLEESLRYYEKGLQLARLVGNLRLVAYATNNRAAALLDLGRYTEAAVPLEEARRLLELLEERGNLVLLSVCEGQREMGMGHWSRAQRIWEQGLSELRDLGAPYDLARALKQVGEFHVSHGELNEGRAYLDEAKGLARKLKNGTLLEEIEARLAVLESRETRREEVLSGES